MTLKFPKELILGGEEWKTQPFRFNVNTINTGGYTPSYRDVTVTGVSPLNLPNAEANGLRNIKLYGKCEQTGTPTLDNPIPIMCNNGTVGRSSGGIIETISLNGQTATAQDLLSCGADYTDVQNVTTGEITRKVGVHIFDGTENWSLRPTQPTTGVCYFYRLTGYARDDTATCYCSTFNISWLTSGTQPIGTLAFSASYIMVFLDDTRFPTADDWQNYLLQQYNNGTPVILTYILATPTTETVAAQTNLQTIAGNNTLTITQAAVDGLQMEVTYSAGVEVTIESVQNANVDQQVEVTIGG